jgi:hypothetical protein
MNRSQRLLTLCEIFTPADVDAAVETLQSGIHAPVVKVWKSTLGGADRVSILILVSLDPRETWTNGILENSRYFRMDYLMNGSLELFSGGFRMLKFRKARVKSPDDAVMKINKYIELNQSVPQEPRI